MFARRYSSRGASDGHTALRSCFRCIPASSGARGSHSRSRFEVSKSNLQTTVTPSPGFKTNKHALSSELQVVLPYYSDSWPSGQHPTVVPHAPTHPISVPLLLRWQRWQGTVTEVQRGQGRAQGSAVDDFVNGVCLPVCHGPRLSFQASPVERKLRDHLAYLRQGSAPITACSLCDGHCSEEPKLRQLLPA
jgi:hypothetical protein